jgi:hypothetical protein
VPVSLKRFAMDFLVFCMTFRKTENKGVKSIPCKGETTLISLNKVMAMEQNSLLPQKLAGYPIANLHEFI